MVAEQGHADRGTKILAAIGGIAAVESQLPQIGVPGIVLTALIGTYIASVAGLVVLACCSVDNRPRHLMIYKILKVVLPWPALVAAVEPDRRPSAPSRPEGPSAGESQPPSG